METRPVSPSIEISRDELRGAVYVPMHVERQVKIYPIQEHELRTISTFNNQMTLWSSIGSSAVVLVLSCLWDMLDAAVWPPVSRIGFVVLCVLVAVGSFLLVWWYWRSRQNELDKILSETRSGAG